MRFDSAIPVKIKDAYAARQEPEAQRILARAYWAFLILLTTGTAAAALAYGTWEFFRTPTEDAVADVHPRSAFSKADLDALLSAFDERAANLEARLAAPALARDPSGD